MNIVTLKRLDSANRDVTNELSQLGFWTDSLAAIQLWLVPFSWNCYGWQWYGGDSSICIPSVSLIRVGGKLIGRYAPLRDVLRHEWAHAIADTHRSLFQSKRFSDAFGASHDGTVRLEFHSEHHVSKYASTHPSEDFAEVFMFYVKHGGKLPSRFNTPGIKRRWKFVDELKKALRSSRNRPKRVL